MSVFGLELLIAKKKLDLLIFCHTFRYPIASFLFRTFFSFVGFYIFSLSLHSLDKVILVVHISISCSPVSHSSFFVDSF